MVPLPVVVACFPELSDCSGLLNTPLKPPSGRQKHKITRPSFRWEFPFQEEWWSKVWTVWQEMYSPHSQNIHGTPFSFMPPIDDTKETHYIIHASAASKYQRSKKVCIHGRDAPPVATNFPISSALRACQGWFRVCFFAGRCLYYHQTNMFSGIKFDCEEGTTL